MRPNQDAFGHALFDLDKARNKKHLMTVNRDDGHSDEFLLNLMLSEYPEWSSGDKKAMRCVKGSVLDVGCGAGRHALYLQSKGHPVTGIDNAPLAVRFCRCRGLKDARLASVLNLKPGLGKFDSVLFLGNNFCLVGTPENARKILRTLRGLTNKDAVILAHCTDPYGTKHPPHLKYHAENIRKGKPAGQLRFRLEYKKYTGPWMNFLMLSLKEFKDIVKGTGWRFVRVMEPGNASYIALLKRI